MGSRGHRWVQCNYCDRWGKCTEWFWDYTRDRWADGFWDIDGIGVLCCACKERDYPPHSEYVQTLFPLPPTAASIIAGFAHPVYVSSLAFDAFWNSDDVEGFD